MKDKRYVKRFNESSENPNVSENEQELISMIEDIISSEVYIREVPYSMQPHMETDPDSITDAAKKIISMLKGRGVI